MVECSMAIGCDNCHCCLRNCSINIFFVPSVQKTHFDVVFNSNVWTQYILVFSEDIYLTCIFTFFFPAVLLAVPSLTVVIATIINVSVLVKKLSPADFVSLH